MIEKNFETENCFQNINKVNINGQIFLIFKDSYVKNTKKSFTIEKIFETENCFQNIDKVNINGQID